MANFAYKKTVITAMKVVGILDSDNLTVDVGGEKVIYSSIRFQWCTY